MRKAILFIIVMQTFFLLLACERSHRRPAVSVLIPYGDSAVAQVDLARHLSEFAEAYSLHKDGPHWRGEEDAREFYLRMRAKSMNGRSLRPGYEIIAFSSSHSSLVRLGMYCDEEVPRGAAMNDIHVALEALYNWVSQRWPGLELGLDIPTNAGEGEVLSFADTVKSEGGLSREWIGLSVGCVSETHRISPWSSKTSD